MDEKMLSLELVDDESLFLFGLMGQLSELITTRQSLLVNL